MAPRTLGLGLLPRGSSPSSLGLGLCNVGPIFVGLGIRVHSGVHSQDDTFIECLVCARSVWVHSFNSCCCTEMCNQVFISRS